MKIDIETEMFVRTVDDVRARRRQALRDALGELVAAGAKLLPADSPVRVPAMAEVKGGLDELLERADGEELEFRLRYPNVDQEAEERTEYAANPDGTIAVEQHCRNCGHREPCVCARERAEWEEAGRQGEEPREPLYKEVEIVLEPGQPVTVPLRLVIDDHLHTGFSEAVLWVGRDPDVAAGAAALLGELRRGTVELLARGEGGQFEKSAKEELLGALLELLTQPTVVSGGWNGNLRLALLPAFAWGERDPGAADDVRSHGASPGL